MLLVLGKSGQLAQELAKLGITDCLFAGRDTIDLSKPDLVKTAILDLAPSGVINAAAYTAVDQAEIDQDAAFDMNAHAVCAAAAACKELNVPFVHVSTDYVFAGNAGAPYDEEAIISPINTYGASKAAGEQYILETGGNFAILRTSWLYSEFGNNFVKTMIRLANSRDSVDVVSDQFGSPTYAADLAQACLFLQSKLKDDSSASGIYHFSNQGTISWADFAAEVFRLNELATGKYTALNRINSDAFPVLAKRPAWSALDTSKIESLGLPIQNWKTRLAACFALLLA
jgi:dTDP-4-dehydrorhamnose reductase